ncbi:MAG: multicomponent Na+:H+ antiporter subunit [Thermosediminibacterales bacterium]|nr:multicomponent Na+:H+ antiporter subunit [Thermosediminibacterales bacterium]
MLKMLPFTAVILPVFISVFIGILGKKSKKTVEVLTIFTTIFTASIVFVIMLNTIKGPVLEQEIIKVNPFLAIKFKVDAFGILFSTLASVLWVFASFYSIGYMAHGESVHRYFTFFAMCLGITLGIAFSGNLFTFYIFYELLTLATYPLVVHKENFEAMAAGKKYLAYSLSGAALILLAIIVTYGLTENLEFIPKGVFNAVTDNYVTLRCLFYAYFIGFGVKAAIVPLHSWLPSAMVAPTPVSALLHAVAVVKSGVFAIIRVVYFVYSPELLIKLGLQELLLIIITITIIFGSVLALSQKNLKKRLAYSTISQLGYILLGGVLFSKGGLTGGLLHIVNHALLKITLFFCAGSIIVMTGKTEIEELRGIGRQMPITMLCFTVASIGLIGIPPTNGFVSKWYLSLGSLEVNRPFYIIILLISAFLTAGYLIPVIVKAFFEGKEINKLESKEPPLNMLLPIVIITLLGVLFGVLPDLPLIIVKKVVGNFY